MKKRVLSLWMSLVLLITLLPATVQATENLPFTSSAGTSVTVTADGYSYTEYVYDANWTVVDTIPHSVPLYTVTVPPSTQGDTLQFSEERIAYGYDASGQYLSTCATDAEGGYGSFGQVGELTAIVRPTSANRLPDYVWVQTPYDSAWHSDLLYVIAFETEQNPLSPLEETTHTLEELLTHIASDNAENSDVWWLLDMASYAKLCPDSPSHSTAEAKQSYINQTIATLHGTSVGDAEYAKAILTLTAIGADVTQLYPVNSNVPLDILTPWDALSHSSSAWIAPYTLAAYQAIERAEDAQPLLTALLENQQADGSWSEWGTIDTTANVIAGLSLYADDALVAAAIDRGLDYLSTQMRADGSFDGGYGANANSTAMVLVALAAAGINPLEDSRFQQDGVTALDGLLRFALADGSGFGYQNATSYNASATEQSFRALVAMAQLLQTSEAYNVYDVRDSIVSPVRASGSKQSQHTPSEVAGETVQVFVTVKSDRGYWLRKKSVTLSLTKATVCDALLSALVESGITQDGAEDGYVRSMQKGDDVLEEFGQGKNSGWLYQVNGTLPTEGLTDYTLQDGDSVVWYYTEDWTKDPSAKRHSKAQSSIPPDTISEPVAQSFADVSAESWYGDAVHHVVAKGWMQGIGAGQFAPQQTLERGMMAMVLYRMAGSPTSHASHSFRDVSADYYASEAIAWCASQGIVLGKADGSFAPQEELTREQMASMLYRYAKSQDCLPPYSDDLKHYADCSTLSWSREAMQWAVACGLLQGVSDRRLAPQSETSRAAFAVLLQRFDEGILSAKDWEIAQTQTVKYLSSAVPQPSVGSIGGEWSVIALNRSGAEVGEGYLEQVRQTIQSKGAILHSRKYTENSRVILALTALGQDARQIYGHDLTLALGDFDAVLMQGVNGAIYALLALDCGEYPLPQGASASRERYVTTILEAQQSDGGWRLGEESDADLTAMALQALAKYQTQSEVQMAVRQGILYLSRLQAEDGDFGSAETCAQVLLAMGELGLAPDDTRLVRDGHTVLDALLHYQLPDGSFCHSLGGASNLMATEQALCALTSCVRGEHGLCSLYRMQDTVALVA